MTDERVCRHDCIEQGTHRDCDLHMERFNAAVVMPSPVPDTERAALRIAIAKDLDAQFQRETAELRALAANLGKAHGKAQDEARAAEAELRRLGHGSEVIDVITESGTRFTSYVGDASWDTAGNRARVRAHHASVEAELAQLRERVDKALKLAEAYGLHTRIAAVLRGDA